MDSIFAQLSYVLQYLDTFERFCVLACSKQLCSKVVASSSQAADFVLPPSVSGQAVPRAPWLHAAVYAAQQGALHVINVDLGSFDARSKLHTVLNSARQPLRLSKLSLSHGKLNLRTCRALALIQSVNELAVKNISIPHPIRPQLRRGSTLHVGSMRASAAPRAPAPEVTWAWASTVRHLTCSSSPWLVDDTVDTGHMFNVQAGGGGLHGNHMLTQFRSLQHADISNASNGTIAALQGATSLRSLILRDSRICPIRGVTPAYAELVSRLEALTLIGCHLRPRHVTEQPHHAIVTEILTLAPNLQSLCIERARDDVSLMTGSNLSIWAGVLAELATGVAVPSAYEPILNMYGHSIHPAAAQARSDLPPGPQLRNLTLHGLSKVSAADLLQLASALGGAVQHLELQVERRGLQWGDHMAPRLLQQLKYGPTSAGWVQILGSMTRLRALVLTDWPGLDDELLDELPRVCPVLHHVRISTMRAVTSQTSATAGQDKTQEAFAGPTTQGVTRLRHTLQLRNGTLATSGTVHHSALFDQQCSPHREWLRIIQQHGALMSTGQKGEVGSAQSMQCSCVFGCGTGVCLPPREHSSAAGSANGSTAVSQTQVWQECMLDHAEVCPLAPLPCTNAPLGTACGPAIKAGTAASSQTVLTEEAELQLQGSIWDQRQSACRCWVPRYMWGHHCVEACPRAQWQCPFRACRRWMHPLCSAQHMAAHETALQCDAVMPQLSEFALSRSSEVSNPHSGAAAASATDHISSRGGGCAVKFAPGLLAELQSAAVQSCERRPTAFPADKGGHGGQLPYTARQRNPAVQHSMYDYY